MPEASRPTAPCCAQSACASCCWGLRHQKLAVRSPLDMLARWATGSRLVCLWLAVVIAAWYAPHPFTSNHEARVRFAGLILQLVGIGTVVYGTRRTRHLLRQPFREHALITSRRELPAVFRSRRAYGAPPQASPGSAPHEAASSKPAGAKRTPRDERVAALEAKLLAAHDRIAQTQRRLDDEMRVRDRDDNWERTARQEADEQMWKALEEVSSGGLGVSGAGLLWLLLGVALSAAAGEVARLLLPTVAVAV